MCGIIAYFNQEGVSSEIVKKTIEGLQLINHRGPDDEGITLINTQTGDFYNLITEATQNKNLPHPIEFHQLSELKFNLLLGHRRLSIIDLSTNGHQPMFDNLGNWIVFNGEIYNYIELKLELKTLNYNFKTESDTEVILAAYETWGAQCFQKFNGMFSIVIYNYLKKELCVANDRYGVKPLNYFASEKEIVFASEIRQIKALGFNLTINQYSLSNYLNHAYLDHNNSTFFNEIKRFPFAHFDEIKLTNKKLQLHPKVYYELDISSKRVVNPIEEFKNLLTDAVKLRLRSDVPIGFASSGGLDSSAVLYTAYHLLKDKTTNLSTFSAVFPGLDGDESLFIKKIENDLKLRTNYVNPLDEFSVSDFERHIYHQEYPVQSTSYYAEWCVARMVKQQNVKVLLIGQGGDEILAGYHHHFYRYCRQLILQGKFLKYFSLLKKYCELKGLILKDVHSLIINEVKLSFKLKSGLSKMSNTLNKNWNKPDKLINLLKLDLSEYTLPTYLRSDDRDSMAFSLETRHPFLDYRLVDFCFSLPNKYKIKDGWQKWILREAMSEMPSDIRFRTDKKGYSTPQEEWINKNKNEFEDFLKYIPNNITLRSKNPFLNYSLGAWFKTNY